MQFANCKKVFHIDLAALLSELFSPLLFDYSYKLCLHTLAAKCVVRNESRYANGLKEKS